MIKQVNADTFANEVYNNVGPVVVAFSATWCAPCRAYKPNLEKLAETGVKVVTVDITDSPELSEHFAINSVPTTVFFAGGEPKLVVNGARSVESLQELINEAVADSQETTSVDNFWTKLVNKVKRMFASVSVPSRV